MPQAQTLTKWLQQVCLGGVAAATLDAYRTHSARFFKLQLTASSPGQVQGVRLNLQVWLGEYLGFSTARP